MKLYSLRLFRLICGFIICSAGIAITMKANIGYAPWDAFHAGFTNITGLSIGVISILVGIAILLLTLLLGERIGIGTVLNMIIIGIFLDIFLDTRIIPVANNLVTGLVMDITGLFIMSIGTYLYIGASFGAGPRDGLMIALSRKTGLPVGICRGTIELTVLFIGWRLGGMIGIGTIISAFAVGFCVQIVFKLFHFDASAITHETFDQTYQTLFLNKSKHL